ncbi:PAK4-inhibitor INKA2 isoform X1 [Entelurus aequoreus]|uniref:PAK4-inhibitor INKA2 isoform X1 n=2 Tax=Entelurus aequoreus TaxID=161455 RepID=UPI002B1DA439|nr:PAK4-inhibitor INKA2 isoform X1 [Entelurus aequoreus]XP_061893718.1 PAK4-inhibitor INKA2 isoform X1 [Entelurus aequoreus]
MEQQTFRKKNMDVCLRRLKQELVSMKEAGDGLHAQMNSMMGALQELKLLQVQTTLESLSLSARPVLRGGIHHRDTPVSGTTSTSASVGDHRLSDTLSLSPDTSMEFGATFSRDGQSRYSSEETLSSGSSLELDRVTQSENNQEALPRRWSGYMAPQVDFYGPVVGTPPPEPYVQSQAPPRSQVVDLPNILNRLSREGPSLDNNYSQDGVDDAGDWTSSLMSRTRNRQPLVLGDNIFADLVGNWLDLPEVETDVGKEETRMRREVEMADESSDIPDAPAHPLRLSRSQEICRKFSLTTNIFKKFFRSVRPDRDKLLKERPGWMLPELPEGDFFKRPRKMASKSSQKGSFYLPFWANNGPQCKERLGHTETLTEQNHFHHVHDKPFAGIYLDRRQPETSLRKVQPLFDNNKAVWV